MFQLEIIDETVLNYRLPRFKRPSSLSKAAQARRQVRGEVASSLDCVTHRAVVYDVEYRKLREQQDKSSSVNYFTILV